MKELILKLILCASLFGTTFNISVFSQRLKGREYKSTDKTTAGFSDISLKLYESGKLILVKREATYAGAAKDGGVDYSIEEDTLHGNWKSNQNQIECRFIAKKTLMDSALFLNDFVTKEIKMVGENSISFPAKLDTIFIYGHPCISVGGK